MMMNKFMCHSVRTFVTVNTEDVPLRQTGFSLFNTFCAFDVVVRDVNGRVVEVLGGVILS